MDVQTNRSFTNSVFRERERGTSAGPMPLVSTVKYVSLTHNTMKLHETYTLKKYCVYKDFKADMTSKVLDDSSGRRRSDINNVRY